MKAFLLLWQNPEGYKDRIILAGTLHLEYASIKMLGKKRRGSGLEDTLLDSRLISGGSLARVMQGEHYGLGSSLSLSPFESTGGTLA